MEAVRKTKKRTWTTSVVSVIISVTLVLFMLGSLATLLWNAKRLSDHVKSQFQFTVLLKDNTSESEIDQLKSKLQYAPYAQSVQFVSKEDAAKIMQEELDEEFVTFLGFNPLPNSFDVNLKPEYVDPTQLKKIEGDLLTNESILEIDYDRTMLKSVYENIRSISFWLLLMSGVFLLICFTLINGNIRLSIYSKRFAIKTMQLVGATGNFIRKPFLRRNVFLGIVGACLAALMLFSFIYFVENQVLEFKILGGTGSYVLLFLFLLISGILITFWSTLFSLNKFLRLNMDEMYY